MISDAIRTLNELNTPLKTTNKPVYGVAGLVKKEEEEPEEEPEPELECTDQLEAHLDVSMSLLNTSMVPHSPICELNHSRALVPRNKNNMFKDCISSKNNVKSNQCSIM